MHVRAYIRFPDTKLPKQWLDALLGKPPTPEHDASGFQDYVLAAGLDENHPLTLVVELDVPLGDSEMVDLALARIMENVRVAVQVGAYAPRESDPVLTRLRAEQPAA